MVGVAVRRGEGLRGRGPAAGPAAADGIQDDVSAAAAGGGGGAQVQALLVRVRGVLGLQQLLLDLLLEGGPSWRHLVCLVSCKHKGLEGGGVARVLVRRCSSDAGAHTQLQ